MPIINWEFSIWNVAVYLISAIGLLWGIFHVIDKRIAVFESTLQTHANTLTTHASRMDRHDDRLITVIEQLQRLIGHVGGRERRGSSLVEDYTGD